VQVDLWEEQRLNKVRKSLSKESILKQVISLKGRGREFLDQRASTAGKQLVQQWFLMMDKV
jgi:hypothetical protein